MTRFDKRMIGDRTGAVSESRVRVRFQDVDAAGIVFFARFFDYVHEAYEDFLLEAGTPLSDVLKERAWAAPLRHAEADYLKPARFGAVLRVSLVLAAIEESELTLGWRIDDASEMAQKPTAIVQTVHAFVEPTTFERVSVPAEISRKLEPALVAKS